MTNEPITTLVNGLSELDAEADRRANYRITRYFPETGPCRRDLYPKHLQFFAAGATHRIRAFLAGNRVGKSAAGAFETTLHLTGEYPAWWEGRRFEEAVHVWAAGDTAKTVRDILQAQLLGRPGAPGTGMIPAHLVDRRSAKQGLADAVETAWVRHRSGGTSVVTFKSYDQRREAFQGTAQHLIWLDEEPPEDICQWQPKTAHFWQLKTAHVGERAVGRSGRSPVDAHRACWAGRRERRDRSPGQHAPRRCGAGGHDATPSRRSSDAVRSQC